MVNVKEGPTNRAEVMKRKKSSQESEDVKGKERERGCGKSTSVKVAQEESALVDLISIKLLEATMGGSRPSLEDVLEYLYQAAWRELRGEEEARGRGRGVLEEL